MASMTLSAEKKSSDVGGATVVIEEPPEADSSVTIDLPEKGAPGDKGNVDPEAALEEMRQKVEEATEARRKAEAAVLGAQEQSNRHLAAQQQAERLAAQRAQEVQRVRGQASEAEHTAIINALQNAEKTRDALQAQFASLGAESQWAEQAKVSSALGEVSAQIVRLKDGKAAAESREAQARQWATEEAQAQQAQQAQVQDARSQQDAWLATVDPYNAAWIRQNRDRFFNDKDFERKAIAASGYAINNKGYQAGSIEYFRFIDEAVGLRQPAQAESESTGRSVVQEPKEEPRSMAAKTVSRVSPTPTAPPSRTSTTTTSRRQEITLSAAERAHARATLTKDIIGDQDPDVVFAKHKAELMKSGRWSGERFEE
jgi:hypothetical protein